MPSYLKPLVQQQNIWHRVYSRPHTGTCQRQTGSAQTLTGLRPPRGSCPVKKRLKESNYCLTLTGSFCFLRRALAKLGKCWICLEVLSMDTDQLRMLLQNNLSLWAQTIILFSKYGTFIFFPILCTFGPVYAISELFVLYLHFLIYFLSINHIQYSTY